MTEQDINLDQEDEDNGSESRISRSKDLQAFRRIPRELTEEELANSAVQKLLVGNLDRLETEKEEYRLYMERFHEADKKVAVLEQKSRTALALDIIFGGCLTVGGSVIGLSHGLWSHQPFGWIVLVAGVVMLIIGIVAKVKAP